MSSNTEAVHKEKSSPDNCVNDEEEPQTNLSQEVRSVLSENLKLRESLKCSISSLDERNSVAEEEVINLKQENAVIWANVKRANAEIEEITKDFEQLETEYKMELVKREELSAKNESLKAVFGEVTNCVESIEKQINEAQTEANNIKKNKELVNNALETLNQQFTTTFNQLLQDHKQLTAQLKFQNANGALSLSEANAKRMKLKDNINCKRTELEQLILQFGAVKNNVNEINRKVAQGEENCRMKKNRIAEIQNEIQEVEKTNKQRILEFDAQLIELQNENVSLHEAVATKRNSILHLKAQEESYLNKAQNLKDVTNEAVERITPLKQNISSLNEEASSLEGKIESWKEKIRPLSGNEVQNLELRDQTAMMDNKIRCKTSEMNEKQSQLTILREKNSELHSTHTAIKNRVEEGNEEVQRLTLDLNEYANIISKTAEDQTMQINEMRETNDKLLELKKDYQRQLLEAETSDQQLENDLTEVKTFFGDYNLKVEALKANLEILNERSKGLEKTVSDEKQHQEVELARRSKEIAELQVKIESSAHLEKKLEELVNEFNFLVDKKRSDMELFNEQKSKAAIEMENYMKARNEQTKNLEQGYKTAKENILKKIENTNKEIGEAKKKIELKEKDISVIKENIRKFQEAKEKYEKDCQKYEQLVDKATKELKVMKRDIYNAMHKEKPESLMSDDNNMPPFSKEFNSLPNPEDLQRKLYFLNEQLQIMARELPPKYQQRIPNELLCSLAESLLDNTVFGIVNHLMDIQHVTEKQLFQQRLQFTANQSQAMHALASNQELDDSEKQVQRAALEKKHREELIEYDKKVIMELDQKVNDQQRILDMAGVPGFDVTNDPMKIQVQIRLLDFILRLSQMKIS